MMTNSNDSRPTDYNWTEIDGKLVYGEWLKIGDDYWFIEREEPYQYDDCTEED